MRRPTETALKSRARALLEAMTARARWIYAVPRDDGPDAVREIAIAEGYSCVEDDAQTRAARYENAKKTASITVRDEPDLEVLILDAAGDDAPEALAKILDKAGFYAQSTLLGTAFDVEDEESADALGTLAHMVVSWDDAWRDLFALHLGAADPALRRRAVDATIDAVRAAGKAGPAAALLEAAMGKEKDDAIRERMASVREIILKG